MDKLSFLSNLNDEQLQAVKQTQGPVLVLAGAGSGKTTTIVARVAYILENDLAKANEIAVFTFTKKAAAEMKERARALLSKNGLGEVGEFSTFHSWGYRFLRSLNASMLKEVGLEQVDQVADENSVRKVFDGVCLKLLEQFDLLEESRERGVSNPQCDSIIEEFCNTEIDFLDEKEATKKIRIGIERKVFDVNSGAYEKALAPFAKYWKCALRAEEIKRQAYVLGLIYVEYKKALRERGLIDYSDMILLSNYFLAKYDILRAQVGSRYHYVMVDEFQDTNASQMRMLGLLLENNRNICVVGDDAQSIYGWRGAKIEYILNFDKLYEDAVVINLSKNYRSDKQIVEKSNALLKYANEKHNKKKPLESMSDQDGVVFYDSGFRNPVDEAEAIAKDIKACVENGSSFDECAVLFRINSHIGTAVEVFAAERIPFYVVNDRKEILDRDKAIKGYLDYLELVCTLGRTASGAVILKTIVSANVVAQNEAKMIERYCKKHEISIMSLFSSGDYKKIKNLSDGSKSNLEGFLKELKEMYDFYIMKDFRAFLNYFNENNGVIKHYRALAKSCEEDDAGDYYRTVGLLVMQEFERICEITNAAVSKDEFFALIQNAGLGPRVTLCTVHAAKGLEWDNVYVFGLVDGVFPFFAGDNEEERRLAYVAFSRPRKRLMVTAASKGYWKNAKNRVAYPSEYIFQCKMNKGEKDVKQDIGCVNSVNYSKWLQQQV